MNDFLIAYGRPITLALLLLLLLLGLASCAPAPPSPPSDLKVVRLVPVEWEEHDLCLNPCELKVRVVKRYEWRRVP